MDEIRKFNRSMLFMSLVGGGAIGFVSGLSFGILALGPGREAIPAAVGLTFGLIGGLTLHFVRLAAVKWLTDPGRRPGPQADYDDRPPTLPPSP